MGPSLRTASEVVAALRELADRLEQTGPPPGPVDIRAHLTAFDVTDRETLRWFAWLMDAPQAQSRGSHHWIKGRVGEVEISVHYKAGLLGKTKRRTRVIVETETEPDVQGLLAGTGT